MRKLFVILAVVIMCRVFCFCESDKDEVSKEIEVWLIGKRIISVTSDSQGGYGFGARRTCLTIIAEELKN